MGIEHTFVFDRECGAMELMIKIALIGYVTYSVLGAPVAEQLRADIDRKLAR